jgi:hypothetical protein
MDAKVRLVLPVHRRDAEEMIGLAHPRLRLMAEVVSAGRVADLDVAARHNFQELFRERGRDSRPSAWVDAGLVGLWAHRQFQEMPPRVASADREQVAPVVAVAKVVARPDRARSDAELLKAVRLAAAMVRQAAVSLDEEPHLFVLLVLQAPPRGASDAVPLA